MDLRLRNGTLMVQSQSIKAKNLLFRKLVIKRGKGFPRYKNYRRNCRENADQRVQPDNKIVRLLKYLLSSKVFMTSALEDYVRDRKW